MAGVFLSYDREDTDKARPIALAIEKAGHSVWWDFHVRGNAQFSKAIERPDPVVPPQGRGGETWLVRSVEQ